MVDRVRFREFAQVRKANKTIAWPAGEYDYVPEMDPILADGRALRVPPVEPLVEHVQERRIAPLHVQAAQDAAPAPPLRLQKQGKG